MSNVTITRLLAPAQALNTFEVRPSSIRIRRGERRCSWTRGLAVLGAAVAFSQIGSAGAFAVPAGMTPKPRRTSRHGTHKSPDRASDQTKGQLKDGRYPPCHEIPSRPLHISTKGSLP
jgi:hypothetical protein